MGWEVHLLTLCLALEISATAATDSEQVLGYSNSYRRTRHTDETDKTVEQLLSWLQDKYRKSTRIARQETLSRNYLPVTTTQQPRPFQTSDQGGYTQSQGGYQQPGYTTGPNGRFPSGTSTAYPSGPAYQPGYQNTDQTTGYPSGRPSYQPGYQSTEYPQTTGYPSGRPSYQPGYQSTDQPQTTGYPSGRPSYQPGYQSTEYPQTTGYPSGRPSYQPGYQTTQRYPSTPYPATQQPTDYPQENPTGFPGPQPPSRPPYKPTDTSRPGFVSEVPGGQYPTFPGTDVSTGTGGNLIPPDGGTSNAIDDQNHPPHIHSIDVQCSKNSMTITIEFNRNFDGVIYSKGFYSSAGCRYVLPNSGRSRYTFTVALDSCGTQFVDEFDQGRPAYLENVLVLQNEPGIQEVWDTVRSVRCLWEGSISKALSVALSVGSLQQEVVTFSGDTASARLDIQVGRGPYAGSASGLVKIGETMTLVVTVEGDPGFTVLVRDCWASDGIEGSPNRLQLTDDNGCVLKPKLMGAWQETRDTQAIRTYAFFQAFKFPDVMDLMIECKVELCKAQCSPCQDPNQRYEPGVRRRRWVDNSTVVSDPVRLGKRLHIYMPEDLRLDTPLSLPLTYDEGDNMCMSWNAFAVSFAVLMCSLIVTSFTTMYYILRSNRKY